MAAQVLELGNHVRMVALQFNASKSAFIPTALRHWLINAGRETPEKRVIRKSPPVAGVKVIEETERCLLRDLPKEIEAAGYELVDVLYEERIDVKDPTGRRTYHMVRFLFARHEFAEVSEDFKTVRNTAHDALRHICESAFWRVRAFVNPFYKDGEDVAGFNAASINMEVRVPLFQNDGSPVLERRKDEHGKKVGDPLPLKPDYSLRIEDGAVRLMTV